MTTKEQQIIIQHLLDSGHSFALYRLPGADHVDLVLQDEEQPTNIDDVTPDRFVFAPFKETSNRPTIYIRPDRTASNWEEISLLCQQMHSRNHPRLRKLIHNHAHQEEASNSEDYKQAFCRLHGAIRKGRFEKLVLSYCQASHDKNLLGHEAEVFLKALDAYPNAMVYIVYDPQCGRWMGSTPELLLQRTNNKWHTVALAGTTERASAKTAISTESEWDSKNIYEQDVVSKYIKQTLQMIGANDIEQSACETIHIGNLSHRRTLFNFTLSEDSKTAVERRAGKTLDVARALHPTPAVCGLPKEEAKAYLTRNEHTDRNYFSGFLGRINSNGDAHLFVNLRCAQITEDCTYYHAGGGLTEASKLDDEAKEIDLKMETLKALL